MTITIGVVAPSSRALLQCFSVLLIFSGGSILINSTDPFDPPLINPNLLQSPLDRLIAREGMKSVQRFLAAPAWTDYIISPFTANATTDEEWDAFVLLEPAVRVHEQSLSVLSRRQLQFVLSHVVKTSKAVRIQPRKHAGEQFRILDGARWGLRVRYRQGLASIHQRLKGSCLPILVRHVVKLLLAQTVYRK